MKKFLTSLLIVVISIYALTGCGAIKSMGYKAQYWHANVATTDFLALNEQVEYDVKVVNTRPNNSTEVSNQYLKMEVNNGKYITKLIMDRDENGEPYYLYETELDLEGKYIVGEEEYPFDNKVTSSTKFKNIISEFKPITSSKQSTKTTTATLINQNYVIYDFTYNYTINYGEKDATSRFELNTLGEKETVPVVKNSTFKKYNSTPYVDNELLLLLPRAYSYDAGVLAEFSTIDVVTNQKYNMMYNGNNSSNRGPDIKKFNLSYKLNGEEVGGNEFETARMSIGISDTFAGSIIEAYYAVDHNVHRHRMVKCYTALNDSLGYLEYTISSATQN